MLQHHVKIYKQIKGEWKFEERSGTQVRKGEEVDSGEIDFMENQQQRSVDDHVQQAFQNNTGGRRIGIEDIGPSASSSAAPSLRPSPGAKGQGGTKKGDSRNSGGRHRGANRR